MPCASNGPLQQVMSGALLRNNKKCNKIEDNRESCLHVLTWMALRFTNHTISGGCTSRFLRAFDKEYKDEGVKGGDLKKGFLLGRDIPHVVKFDRRPRLNKLIEELTEAFAVHYEKPPSTKDLQALEDARVSNVPESVISNLPALSYQKHLNDLATPSWLVDTFRRHLDADPWPLSDKAQRQFIGIGSSKKQAREQAKLELGIPHAKSQRFSNGSGSRVPSDDGLGD
jgi:hypothetical protein